MQAFLEQVVKGLVDHPDAVNITEVEQERTTVYELRLDPSDVGRVIGRSGRTVNAIRTLLQAGVPARCRQVMGTSHGIEIFAVCCPEISRETAASIAQFCREA